MAKDIFSDADGLHVIPFEISPSCMVNSNYCGLKERLSLRGLAELG